MNKRSRNIALLIGTGVSVAMGAFTDDFSQASSASQWVKNSDKVDLKVENGECTVINKDTAFSGLAMHTLSDAKTTFTLKGKITIKSTGETSAGFICCLAATGMPTGYYVSIVRNELIQVHKVGTDGKGVALFLKKNAYITTGTNELRISKKDSTFNLFCNGAAVGTFTDKSFASGNIAMQLSNKATAVFDDIVITDSFEPIVPITCFKDNFDDGDLAGWSYFGDDGAEVSNSLKALQIKTGKDQNLFEMVEIPLTDFAMKAILSHRSGSNYYLYGLFVAGDAGTTVPVVSFGINGGQSFAVFKPGEQFQFTQSSKIHGAAIVEGDIKKPQFDTLEVIKKQGATDYLFVVNGDTLQRYSGVNFTITGAGVFALDSVTVSADDFSVVNGGSNACPVLKNVSRSSRLKSPNTLSLTGTHGMTFDLLGRCSGVSNVRFNSRVSGGCYLQRNVNGHNGIVVKP